MPYIHDDLPTSPSGALSPVRSNLEDMVTACSGLDKRIGVLQEDMDEFGYLGEGTYIYDVPDVLTDLQRISRIAAICTRDLSSYDDASMTDESQIAISLYHFIAKYRRILEQLTALRSMMASTGSLYGVIGATLHRQSTIVNNLRTAIDTKYMTVKVRAASDWNEQTEAMRSCLDAYPMPVEAWERDY